VLADAVAWAPDLLDGLRLTVLLTFASMGLAMLLGLLLALGRLNPPHSVTYWGTTVFVELIRGSPLLLQLFYIYYVFRFVGIRMPSIVSGILGLMINYGAYLSEVFRRIGELIFRGQLIAADTFKYLQVYTIIFFI
jgi:polar amino acid transport system permease protein